MNTTKLFGAFDSETHYAKDYSVSDLGPRGYCTDPRFDCYLVSFVSEDGFEWRGHPKDCPWDKLAQYNFLSHNVGFDAAVLRRLIELGIAPASVWPDVWHCTANLAVYVGLPRSLAQAVGVAFKHTVSKNIRNNEMKGVRWADMSADLQTRVLAYALDDSRWCLKLWQEYGSQWPENERLLSAHTYAMGEYGWHMDVAGLDRDIELLKRAKFEAENKIPWREEEAILSRKGLAAKCREVGIEPPESLAKDSEECAAWEEKYGAAYPWVAAMRDWRRTNTMLEKYLTMRSRVQPNGRMPYSLMYFGASTGRWSGGGGVNLQNLSKEPLYFDENWSITTRETERSVDMRSKFTASPGKKLIVADFAQIEARVALFLARDRVSLDKIREGISVYDAHALTSGMWDGKGGSLKKTNKTLYALAKARCVAEGTLIYTENGYEEIQNIKPHTRIWDGQEFVAHDGVVPSGHKNCIEVCGEFITPDHEVFIDELQTVPADRVQERQSAAQHYGQSAHRGWREIWELARALYRACAT